MVLIENPNFGRNTNMNSCLRVFQDENNVQYLQRREKAFIQQLLLQRHKSILTLVGSKGKGEDMLQRMV